MARYEAGETLASIARTYDCSPPAISYVVSRSRARHPGAETPPTAPSATEAQLIKAPAGETAATGSAHPGISVANGAPPANGASPANGAAPANGPPGLAPPAPGQSRPDAPPAQSQANAASPSGRRGETWPREANGFARSSAGERNTNPPSPILPGLAPRAAPSPQRAPASPAPAEQADGDPRRTLHLSLGNASQGNGGTSPAEHHQPERQNFTSETGQPGHHQPAGERFAPPERGRDGAGQSGFSDARPAAYHGPGQRADSDIAHRKNGSSSYIDNDLRARVDSDIAAFLAAFDAALAQDTQESRSALREATDRLLRAGARTRIELERLEARMPLPPRDNIGQHQPAWRQR